MIPMKAIITFEDSQRLDYRLDIMNFASLLVMVDHKSSKFVFWDCNFALTVEHKANCSFLYTS